MKKRVESIQDTRPPHCRLQLRYIPASIHLFCFVVLSALRSQGQCGLGCGFAAARLLRFLVRVSPDDGYLSLLSVVCYQVEVSVSG